MSQETMIFCSDVTENKHKSLTQSQAKICLKKLRCHIKVCLTQKGMLPLKYGNITVSSDGVSHKLWHSQCDRWHLILLQKSQDVTRLPSAGCCTLPDCHLLDPTLPLYAQTLPKTMMLANFFLNQTTKDKNKKRHERGWLLRARLNEIVTLWLRVRYKTLGVPTELCFQ